MPTTNTSTATLQNLLTALLAQGNQDQNFSLPPYVYTSMFNTATSFIINQCVALYTSNSQIVDIINPFVKIAPCIPSGGLIPLPKDYRNILGAPSINVKGDLTGECAEPQPPILTPQQFQTANLKGGCLRRPITIVSQSEFDYRSTSRYKKPTYENPIAFFAGQQQTTGRVVLKVCPYDVTMVQVMYVYQEPLFNFAYLSQPDDTYIQNPSDPSNVESIWSNAAFELLLKCLTHLYAAYSRDKTFTDFARLLTETNIL